MTSFGLALRELRTYLLPFALLVLLTAATSAMLMAAPLATRDTASAQLHALTRSAPVDQRDVLIAGKFDMSTLEATDPEPEKHDTGDRVCGYDHDAAARTLQGQVAEDVAPMLGAPTWSATTRTALAYAPDGRPVIASVRAQSDLARRLTWVQGRSPEVRNLKRADMAKAKVTNPELEVAASEATMEALHLRLGSAIELGHNDNASRDTDPGFFWGTTLRARIVGVYRPVDPLDTPWGDEPRLVNPGSFVLSDQRTIMVTLLVPGESYSDMCEAVSYDIGGGSSTMTSELIHQWRMPVRGDVTVSDIPTLRRIPDAVRSASESAMLPFASPQVSSALPTLLTQAADDATAAQTVLGTFYAALAVLSVSSLLVLTLTMTERRASALRRLAARGGSSLQLLGLTLLPLLLAIGVAVGLAAVACRGVFGTWPPTWTVWVALATAAAPLVATFLGVRAQARATTDRTRRRGLRRPVVIVVLGLLLVGTALGIAQLRRPAAAPSVESGLDPILASVPVVLVLTAAALAILVTPWFLRRVVHVARRGRGAVPLVGLARAGRLGVLAAFPVVSLAVGLAFAQLAIGMVQATPSARVTAATHEYLARTRIEGPMSEEERAPLHRLSGVTQVVPAHVTFVAAQQALGSAESPLVVAVDPGRYEQVLADAGLATDLSPIKGITPPAEHDTWGYEAAVVVGGAGPEAVGRQLTLDIGLSQVTARVKAVAPDLTARRSQDRPVIVMPLDVMQVLAPDATPTTVFVLADAQTRSGLGSGTAGMPLTWRVKDASTSAQAVADRPLSRYLDVAVALCALLAAFHVALALLLVLRLTAPARAEAVARLRTMGLTRRQVLGVTLVETLPMGLTGTALGVGLGYALAALLADKVDLGAFTGGVRHPGIWPAWWVPLALGLAALALYVLVVIWDAAAARRRELAATLRIGDAS